MKSQDPYNWKQAKEERQKMWQWKSCQRVTALLALKLEGSRKPKNVGGL